MKKSKQVEEQDIERTHGPVPSGFLSQDFDEQLYNQLTYEEQALFLRLTSREREIAIREFGSDIEAMRIFLNQTPEEKRETIEENLMYKTKENKKGSFNVDLIMDNKDLMDEDKKVDNCLQRPLDLIY